MLAQLYQNQLENIFYSLCWSKRLSGKFIGSRAIKVMSDFDLAQLYGIEVKRLKEAVRKNIRRFHPDFLYELS